MDADLTSLFEPSRFASPEVTFTPGVPIYLLAKHLPDPRRGEPVNFGIVVLHGADWSARFLAEKQERVVSAHLPASIRSPKAAREWASFWRSTLPDPNNLLDAPTDLRVGAPAFIERLVATSKTDFYLEFGGEVLDPVAPDAVPDLCDYLFAELVAQPDTAPATDNVEQVCRQLIRNFGLASDKRLRTNAPILLQRDRTVHAHYAFGTDRAYEAIYQRIPWAPQRANFERNVLATLGLFTSLADAKIAPREKIGALVNLGHEQERAARAALRLIEDRVVVYNLADAGQADDAFGRLAALDPLAGTPLDAERQQS